MRSYFTVTGLFGTCKYESKSKVISVLDCRDFSRPYPEPTSPYMFFSDTIDFDELFLKQIALQITPQISAYFGKYINYNSSIALPDRYVIKMNNCVYILVQFSLIKGVSSQFWIKFSVENTLQSKDRTPMLFELCSKKECEQCDIIRIGYYYGDWVEDISNLLKISSKKPTADTRPSYPDVVLSCTFSKNIDDVIKEQTIEFIDKYIERWNSANSDDFQIHFVQEIEAATKKSVCVHIDFGNCNPTALQDLIDALNNSHLKIKKIRIGM